MTLWFVLALMTAAAMFAVLWPLARRDRHTRSGSDLAVYRDQLEEIGRDRAAGRIGDGEAEAAQVEVSRRLLAAADVEAAHAANAPAALATRRRRGVAIAALVALPLGAASVYLALGSPSLPDQPLAARRPDQSIESLVAQVEAHLAANPNDGRGWELISGVYLRLGRFDDAVNARRKALALNGESSDRLEGLGEALVAAADNVVTAEAKSAFERAVALDGENVKARYFLGVAAEQDGRPADAATIWRAMLANATADAPWVEFVRSELARVGGGPNETGPNQKGPNEKDLAAASDLSPEQRTAMVRSMVERLADRLHHDGSDLDGWLQLVRSYMVLGEREKAQAAAGEARRAFEREPAKLRQIDELTKGLGLEG
jgi:cytochrome c-type biogenesis protein CcmH